MNVTTPDDGGRVEGTVREKTMFPEHRRTDGFIEREAMVRYFVTLDCGDVAVQDQKHLSRGRRSFTKQVLRSFLKNTISRDRFDGAPWIVKKQFACQYGISTEVPPHLRQDAILAEKKSHAVFRKANLEEASSQFLVDGTGRVVPRTGIKVSDHQLLQLQKRVDGAVRAINGKAGPSHKFVQPQEEAEDGRGLEEMEPVTSELVKYPIEDLDLPPDQSGKSRPRLRTIADFISSLSMDAFDGGDSLDSTTFGLLLEIWNTLNVYGEFFCLSSFTLDDFVQSMIMDPEDIDCELVREVHCAVLKKLINRGGDILASSLDVADPQAFKAASSASPDPSVDDDEIADADFVSEGSGISSEATSNDVRQRNKAALNLESWRVRLTSRNFSNGGWQLSLLGVLNQVASRPAFEAKSDKVLSEISHSYRLNTGADGLGKCYSALGIRLRTIALQVATLLAMESKPFKESMESITRGATETRKEKTKLQSMRKPL